MSTDKAKLLYQSELINAMRLPLIYLVILIHTYYNPGTLAECQTWEDYLHFFLVDVISVNALRAAVPCFFVFSAYYFFFKLRPVGSTKPLVWSQEFYYEELSKRIRGLLIPFLLWGFIFIAAISAKNELFALIGLEKDPAQMKELNRSVESLLWDSIDAPLWYIRDLMCMMLLSPLFFYLLRYLSWGGIIAIFIPYALQVETGVLGLGSTAAFFFAVGAYLGMHHLDIVSICRKIWLPALVISLTIPPYVTLHSDSMWNESLLRIYAPMGVITIINGLNFVIKRSARIKAFFLTYSPMVFFIYAANELYILNWVKGLFTRLPLADHIAVRVASYFLVPAVTIFVCVLVYRLMNRYFPKALSILSGGR